MANTLITQIPLYNTELVGQNLYYSVTNDQDVATQLRVKFCADVFINTSTTPSTVAGSPDFAGTFKTTPNNAGVGMWDLRNIAETFVKPDNLAYDGSKYKLLKADQNYLFPIHMIDQFSMSRNMSCYMIVRFYTEFLGADAAFPNSVSPSSTNVLSTNILLINGYVKYTDIIERGNVAWNTQWNYGHSLIGKILTAKAGKFLTNAPRTLFCNIEDYGTLSMALSSNDLFRIKLEYYNNGLSYGTEWVYKNVSTGAYSSYSGSTSQRILHFGCYPANLRGWSTIFNAAYPNMDGGFITVQAFSTLGNITDKYTININCPNLKGYEPIRLKWLNQFGAWDYFTFNKKSTRTIKTEGSTYTQLDGTWNTRQNKILGHRGGTKSFRVNATEKIKMNTDYLIEEYNTTFEELINSPEIYMIKGFQLDGRQESLNKYTIPVRLTSSDFTKKTIANDNLIQYEFEIEKAETLRTQAI